MHKFVGIPFVNSGRDIATGLDCWGLVMEVFRWYGIVLPDFHVAATAFCTIDNLVRTEANDSRWRRVEQPSDGDFPLVTLMRLHHRYINHAGVMVSHNHILHTTEKTGSVLSVSRPLKPFIVGYYEYV